MLWIKCQDVFWWLSVFGCFDMVVLGGFVGKQSYIEIGLKLGDEEYYF